MFLIIALLCSVAEAATLSVFGKNFTTAAYVEQESETFPASSLGVTSFKNEKYGFTSTWTEIGTRIESNVATVSGDLKRVYFYTSDTTPSGSLSLSNVKAVEYIFANASGTTSHRVYFRNAAGTAYAEDVSYRDLVQGPMPCTTSVMLAAMANGGDLANNTVMYTIGASSWSYPTTILLDYDVFDFMTAEEDASNAYNTVAFSIPIYDDVGMGGAHPSDTEICKQSPTCSDTIWQDGPDCDTDGICVTSIRNRCTCNDLAAAGLYSPNYDLLYSFRQRLRAYPTLRKYIGTYVMYSMLEVNNNSAIVSALPDIEAAAGRVMTGSGTTVIVTGTLKTKVLGLTAHAQGYSTILDGMLDEIDAKINATGPTVANPNGMTRSQFCTYMVSDSDCTP